MPAIPLLRRLQYVCVAALALAAAPFGAAWGHEESSAPLPAAEQTLSGTIEDLVVDDRVAGQVLHFPRLRLSDRATAALFGTPTRDMRAGDAVSVHGRWNGKAFEVLGVEHTTFATLPRPKSATSIVAGRLVVYHVDDFAQAKSAFHYQVETDDATTTPLAVDTLPAALRSGMRVEVAGYRADAGLVPTQVTVLEAPPEAAVRPSVRAKAATTHSVLVVMANFSNTAAPAYTAAQAQQVMTTNATSVANFYNEASYGQHKLNVTVTANWVTMAYAQPTCIDTNLSGFTNAANTAASAAGYNTAAYEYVVYLFPSTTGCGWAGLGYIGFPKRAYINGAAYFQTQVVAHEMGHNFGLLHAGSLRCPGVTIGGTCSVAEYGDPFSTMGNTHASHFNAVQKSLLGWFPAGTTAQHGSGSATYTLQPIESAGGSTYAVEVPTANANRTYWIEYRQPIGFDNWSGWNANGAQVRLANPFEVYCPSCDGWSDDTEILDFTPGTSTFNDAALPTGSTYTDPNYPVSIQVVSASASALTVKVTTPGASPTASTTTVSSSANPVVAGTAVTFTASVSGASPTGTVVFRDNGTALSGCTAVALSGSGNTRTAACGAGSLAAGAHTITAAYSGDAANTTSSGSLSEMVNALNGSTNVALASNGGVASASSTYSSAFSVASINDNERAGTGWGAGGGWNDATSNVFPDWVQVTFAGQKTIDHVVVYTLQDNYAAPVEPTDTMTFTKYGVTAFTVQAWNGSAWYTVATVSGNSLVKRTVSFAAVTTDRIRINVTAALGGYSRITEVEAWTTAVAAPASTNVALAGNGGVASVSSSYSAAFPAASINDNERAGTGWGAGGGWNDGTASAFPDWAQVVFAGQKTIDHVVVYTVQDNFSAPVEPSDTMTFTQWGVTAFDVQAWNGSAWYTVASVTGNNLVKRTVRFSPVTTDRIRISVNAALGGYSRITEIEAWSASVSTNVAASGNGGVASASSTYSASFPVASINDGERAGTRWGAGGGWNDATSNSFPDWVQVTFAGQKTIDHVVVYTVQDNSASPVEPSDTMTFSSWGVTGFDVQAWNGSAWTTIASVTGNNLVRRSVSFAAVTTDRIRINVTSALAAYSRITEVEAWGQ